MKILLLALLLVLMAFSVTALKVISPYPIVQSDTIGGSGEPGAEVDPLSIHTDAINTTSFYYESLLQLNISWLLGLISPIIYDDSWINSTIDNKILINNNSVTDYILYVNSTNPGSSGVSIPFGSFNQIPYTNAAQNNFSYGGLDYNGTILNITSSNPEIRLKNNNTGEYTRIIKTNVDNTAYRYNKVGVPALSIMGGDSSYTFGDYTIVVFTSSGTFTTSAAIDVDVLVVAGGGGGGGSTGGGGGAGGLVYSTSYTANGAISVVIGNGGAGGINVNGNNGENTTFGTITAVGGGYGGKNAQAGGAGGSGGGGSTGQAGGQESENPDQGYNGGGSSGSGNYGAGGGGGAGAIGQSGTSTYGGAGGIGGNYSLMFGTTYGVNGVFAGGGGGGVYTSTNYGLGGYGGGGNAPWVDAVINTGGGGGGSIANSVTQAGDGGSGIVLVRYLTASTIAGTQETTIWSSKDGLLNGETGIQSFGDTSGRTLINAGTGIYLNDNSYLQDNDKLYLSTGKNTSIYFDGTNLIINTNMTGGNSLAWFSKNISAKGYITRTSVYDTSKGSALDNIKNVSQLINNGVINHTAYYGYVDRKSVV